MHVLQKVLVSIGCIVSLSSCDEKLTYCEFDDTVIGKEVNKKYIVALGYKGVYVIQGEFPAIGKVGKPGQLLGYSGSCEFPLEQFLIKHPEYMTEIATRLAVRQAKRFKHHVPKVSSVTEPQVVGERVKVENEGSDFRGVRDTLQLRE